MSLRERVDIHNLLEFLELGISQAMESKEEVELSFDLTLNEAMAIRDALQHMYAGYIKGKHYFSVK